MPQREREDKVAHLLELVGHSGQRPSELSWGQQQRADTGESVLALIRSVVKSQGMTAIVSTHDPKARAIADYQLHLVDGLLEGKGRRRG